MQLCLNTKQKISPWQTSTLLQVQNASASTCSSSTSIDTDTENWHLSTARVPVYIYSTKYNRTAHDFKNEAEQPLVRFGPWLPIIKYGHASDACDKSHN